jgi:hypothetical protein
MLVWRLGETLLLRYRRGLPEGEVTVRCGLCRDMKGSAMNVEVINLATRFINPLSWRPNIWHCLFAAITVGTFMYYLAASKLH